MAEDTFKNILFGFILVTLFSVLILTSVNELGYLYSKDTTEVTGGALNIAGFNRSVSTVQSTSENLRERFEKQSIWSVVAGVVVTGIFDIGKTMILMIITPWVLIANVMTQVLHIPLIVTDTILGLVILSCIFGLWALIKVGN